MSIPTSQLASIIIQAGAGAGKTTTLVKTFLENANSFKKAKGRYPRIVITTFTRKATQELKERLFTEAYKNQDQDLVDYLNRKSWVHISTIHGLLVPFLSRYGAKVGLNPEIKMISQATSDQTLKRICKRQFQKNPELLNLLEELSWKDLVSGLNSYIEHRLCHDDVHMDSIERLESESKKKLEEVQWRHKALCFKFKKLELSKSWGKYLELFYLNFSTWDELELWQDTLERRPPFRQDKPPFDVDLFQDLCDFLQTVEKCVDQQLLRPQYWEAFAGLQAQFFSLAENVFPEFLEHKMDSGQLTMADLELITLEVLRRDSDVAKLFAAEWDYWMIDEYQDTSPTQVKILKAFVHESPHFVVGDPQQSIYLFRGARSEVFQDKIQEMTEGGHQVSRLGTNYRSRLELVKFFNDIFIKLSSQFSTMEVGATRANAELHAASLTLVPSEKEEEKKHSNEVLTVLAQIQDLLREGIKPDSIVILSRTNKMLADFLKASQVYQIAVQCPSLSSYWSRREILDLLLLTHFLLNPHDNINLIGLLRSPWFWVSDDLLVLIQDDRSYWRRAWEILPSQAELKKPLEKLADLKKKAQSSGVSSALMEFITTTDFLTSSFVYDSTGRREANIWKFITDLRGRESEPGANLIEFIDEILESESLDVENSQGEAIPVIEPDRVTLLTIHASKGLQFDHVFVVGLGNSPQPTKTQLFTFEEQSKVFSVALKDESGKMMSSPVAQKARDQLRLREQEESLRVFYVALTRAKETLWLSSTDKPRKGSWLSLLPLQKDEGTYEFEGGFYTVQKLMATPEVEGQQGTKKIGRLKPLNFSQGTGDLKVSVTGVLGNLKTYQQKSGVSKVKALEKAQRGTSAHRVFEALALRKGAQWDVSSEWKGAVEYIRNLQTPPMIEILREGKPEWGFAVKMDEVVLQGSIDIWAELHDAVYIVDYKTGSSAHADSAFEQMELYSKALKKMGACSKNKPHKLVAIFPFEERVLIRDLKN